jgi:AcrR family transcriptional regulator
MIESVAASGATAADQAQTRARVERLPIGRGERARARVLHAALEVLAERGFPGFTMEAVALRAGASKTTVYRRWRSRSALLVDAMDQAFQALETPTTGDLRGDLLTLMVASEALLGSQPFPRLLAAVIDAAEQDASLAGLHFALTERRREPVRAVLAEAAARGIISPTVDPELVIDLLVGPAFYRRFVAHRPFPPGYAMDIVDLVLAALATTDSQPSRGRSKAGGLSPIRGPSRRRARPP